MCKTKDYLAYYQILRTYDMEDLESPKGEGVHRANFHCKRKRYKN